MQTEGGESTRLPPAARHGTGTGPALLASGPVASPASNRVADGQSPGDAVKERLLEREEGRVGGQVDGRRLRRRIVPAGEAGERLVVLPPGPVRERDVPRLA